MQSSQHPANYFESEDEIPIESYHRNSTEAMMLYAQKAVDDQTKNSQLFDFEKEAAVPTFHFKEILIGSLLGRGGFCDVSEIVNITLKNGDGYEEKKAAENHLTTNEFTDRHTREFIATHVMRPAKDDSDQNDARYAVKQLSARTRLNSKKCVQGTVDLFLEARFLSVLEHPNIIKMRGKVEGDFFQVDRSFIMLDRLYDTLTDRILKWGKRAKVISKSFGFLGSKKKEKKKELLIERLTVAYDLSFALTYMHSMDMIYRDLKPENIGFDVRGDVKIFDFGLAKELQPSLLVADDLYELTSSTGSPRYMAPEVCLGQPYNKKADVYSFSILLWQILSLEVPYENYEYGFFYDNVMCGNDRPKMDKSWPKRWVDILNCGWSKKLIERPTMNEMLSTLEEEVVELQGYGDNRAISRSEVSTGL